MFEEFKKFAMRGNVVDLAVGVIIGAAFGAIVNSLVGDVIMPLIGAVTGGLDFSNYFVPLSKNVTANSLVEAKKQGAVLAYGSFIWAFLVCQDPDKWTLMVWLSQMQESSPMQVIFAALVLAAIPTLLVFIFCQNIIMRGIIVPTEK